MRLLTLRQTAYTVCHFKEQHKFQQCVHVYVPDTGRSAVGNHENNRNTQYTSHDKHRLFTIACLSNAIKTAL